MEEAPNSRRGNKTGAPVTVAIKQTFVENDFESSKRKIKKNAGAKRRQKKFFLVFLLINNFQAGIKVELQAWKTVLGVE